MSIYLAIACGGAVGAVSRYWVVDVISRWMGLSFPFGTLAVNISGSLLMGFLSMILAEKIHLDESLRLGLLSGMVGAFTTFSAFAMDTLRLMEAGAAIKALVYVVVSVTTCIAAAWAGLIIAKQVV